jgi:hypothetical protein
MGAPLKSARCLDQLSRSLLNSHIALGLCWAVPYLEIAASRRFGKVDNKILGQCPEGVPFLPKQSGRRRDPVV